ncbi:MAG: IS110 family transposase [Phycisphaerales bacterium]|jgi:transposase|nr:IS110 family transposase [Phycisphaerales bacterium]
MSDLNVRYVGLDVHKRVVEVCILSAEGTLLRRDRLAMTRGYLEAYARATLLPTDQVALEATTNSWAVARLLGPFVGRVMVSNPLATKAIAQSKIKTDKVDAQVLAQLLRCEYLPGVWQPDEATSQLRSLTSRRASLVGEQTRIKNRIHSVLAERLIEVPFDSLFSVSGETWLDGLTLDAEGRLLVESDRRLLKAVRAEIAQLDRLLAQRGYQEPRVRLLMTLPGVDLAVAQGLLAALGEIDRFAAPEKAAAYLGLVPSTRQSADKCYHGPITKAGRTHSRWLLVQAAQHVGKHPGPLGNFFRRLAQKKNRNVAVVATARKLVTIAWHMLTANEPYRYAQPQSTETKLARLRVRATGARRKSGPARRTSGKAKLADGTPSRTIRSQAQVFESEGLPPARPLPPGERKMLAATGTAEFAAALTHERIVPRSKRATQAATE